MSDGLLPPSEEQATCIAALEGGNVVVQAQAGAGKTTVFMHCAQRWIAQRPDAHVLIVCYNVNLRLATEQRLAALGLQEQVHAYTVHSLAGKMYGTCIGDTMTLQRYVRSDLPCTVPSPFSLVLVDEGQDLTALMVRVISACVEKTGSRVMVVGDQRQEIYGFTHDGAHAVLAKPEECFAPNGMAWTRCALQKSFRVTQANAAFLNVMLRHPADAPMIGVPCPDAPRPIYVIGDMASGAGIDNIILEVLETHRPEQVAIVAPSVNASEYGCPRIASMLAERLNVDLYTTHKQRADVNEDLLRGKLLISTYHQIKGDERDVVIVLGVDARQYRQDGHPTRDGAPVVRNALHVACTRARKQLVLFHQHTIPPYPTVKMDTLEAFAEVRIAAPFKPQPLSPLSFTMIERRPNWIVSFAADETLDMIRNIISVGDPITLGAPVASRPVNTVRTDGGRIEDVSCYYPPAIMAAVERQRLNETSGSQRTQSKMECDIRCSRRCREGVPPVYSGVVDAVAAHSPPAGCQAWMMLGMLHNTLIKHNFRHELRQMQDFSFLNEAETAYFSDCINRLLNVTRRHDAYDFNADAKRVCEPMKARLRGRVEYCSVEGGCYMPWRFSFCPEPSEEDLLSLLVSMWFRYSNQGRIFCVMRNQLYKVSVESDDVLSSFIAHVIATKRSHELSAAGKEHPHQHSHSMQVSSPG